MTKSAAFVLRIFLAILFKIQYDNVVVYVQHRRCKVKQKFLSLFDIKMWKFLLVGILNTIAGNGLMFLFYNLFHIGYWPSTAISYALASVMSYFLNRYFTFQYKGNDHRVILRFALNIVVCYALGYGLAYLLCRPFIGYILSDANVAQIENLTMLAGAVLFVGFNYLGQRFFTFKENDTSKEDTK